MTGSERRRLRTRSRRRRFAAPRRIASVALLLIVAATSAWGCSTGEDDRRANDGPSETLAERGLLSQLGEWELTFLAIQGGGDPHLYLAYADGSNVRQLDRPPGDKQTPNWSPDGRAVALRWVPADYANPTPILVLGANGMKDVDLSKKTGLYGWSPSWSPDGKRLVTAASRKGDATAGLYVMDADGTDVGRITPDGREAQYATWSPTGDRVAFTYVGPEDSTCTQSLPTAPTSSV